MGVGEWWTQPKTDTAGTVSGENLKQCQNAQEKTFSGSTFGVEQGKIYRFKYTKSHKKRIYAQAALFAQDEIAPRCFCGVGAEFARGRVCAGVSDLCCGCSMVLFG